MTYFTLLYTDYYKILNNMKSETVVGSKKKPKVPLNTLVNKEILINSDCPLQFILDYICNEIVGISTDSDFDLVDTLDYRLLKVKTYQANTNGKDVITSKRTYFIILYIRDEHNAIIEAEPLLAIKSEEFIKTSQYFSSHFGSSRTRMQLTSASTESKSCKISSEKNYKGKKRGSQKLPPIHPVQRK